MRKKILIVDDSTTIRQQLAMTLSPAGYDVLEACDGLEALDVVERQRDIALTICDVNMPRMDGIEMLTRLSERGVSTPVVMLTTEGQPKLIQRAKEAGARGWIIKPFNAALLLRAVEKIAV